MSERGSVCEVTEIKPRLLRRPVAAKYLGNMPLSTLEKRRDIPYFKIGDAVYYDVRDLDAWIETQKIAALVASPGAA